MISNLSVDKCLVKINDELTYTLSITNEEKNIESLRIITPFNEAVSFKWIKVQDILYDDNKVLQEGIVINNLKQYKVLEVVFVGVLIAFPKENPITQIADIYYNIEKVAYMQTSNMVMSYVVDANIDGEAESFIIEADKEEVNRGDEINYRIHLTNKGNKKAEQLLIEHLAPPGTILLKESFSCQSGKSLLTLEESVYIDEINVGEEEIFRYSVKVEDTLQEQLITHVLHMYYRILYPNRQYVIQNSTSNRLNIPIKTAYLIGCIGDLKKITSLSFVTEGDRITYKIEGYNVGTLEARNICFRDEVPKGIKYIEESFKVNGEHCYDELIVQGLSNGNERIESSIPNILPGEAFCISYDIEVLNEWQLGKEIESKAVMTYEYRVSHKNIEEEVIIEAEPVEVYWAYIDPINQHLIEGLEQILTLGEMVEVSLAFINKGNVLAEEIIVWLEIPSYIQLVGDEWVRQEDRWYKKYAFNLIQQESYTEKMRIKIIELPSLDDASIQVQIMYNYRVNSGRIETMSTEETIPVTIRAAVIEKRSINKYFIPEAVCVGEEVAGKIEITNSGNIIANNILIQEQQLKELNFLDPSDGKFYIEKLNPHETVCLMYRAQVMELSSTGMLIPSTYINYHYTIEDNRGYEKVLNFRHNTIDIIDAYISPFIDEQNIQQINTSYCKKGDIIHYKFPICNLGNVSAQNIVVTLPLIPEGEWHQNPLKFNSLIPGENFMVEYDLKVLQIPDKGYIQVAPELSYSFEIKDKMQEKVRTIHRCYTIAPIQVFVQCAVIEEGFGLTRSIDKRTIAIDEVSYCTIDLENRGNSTAVEIYLKESQANDCRYEYECVMINGSAIEGDPFQETIKVEDLEPGACCNISYGIRILEMPKDSQFYTHSILAYSYYTGEFKKKEHIISSPIAIEIEDADVQINVEKCNLSEQSIDLGEYFNFDVVIEVKGNTQAYNLYYSIEAEGISIEPAYNIIPLEIPIISQGQYMSISTMAQAIEFPLNGKCTIRGKLYYEFGTELNKKQRIIYTNEQIKYICAAGPLQIEDFTIEISESIIHLKDLITFSFWLNSGGNCKMENTKLYVKGIEDVGFEIEKMYINDVVYQLPRIDDKIQLGTIYPGQQLIKIEGFMSKIPQNSLCEYSGILEYNTIQTRNKQLIKNYKETLSKSFVFKESGLSSSENISLIQDKEVLRYNETIIYTLRLQNNGNTRTEHIKINMKIDNRLEIDEEYISFRGGICTGNIKLGVYIEALECEEWREIQFKGRLKALIPQSNVETKGIIIYEYRDGCDRLKVCEVETESCQANIEGAYFGKEYFKLEIDRQEVAKGDVIKCKIQCQNGGNKRADDILLSISLPKGFQCYNSIENIKIGKLNPMEKYDIELDVIANEITLEENNGISSSIIRAQLIYKDKGEEAKLEICSLPCRCISPIISLEESLIDNKVIVGENIKYTLQIVNIGNQKADGLKIMNLFDNGIDYVQDTLSTESLFIKENIRIEKQRGKWVLIVETLARNEKVTCTFIGKVKEIIDNEKVNQQIQVFYSYILGEDRKKGYTEYEGVKLEVEAPELTILRICDKQIIEVGEELEVSIKLVNTGSIDLDQILLYGSLPDNLLFVEGSFRREDVKQKVTNIEKGIGIGPLKRKEQLMLFYKLRVQNYMSQFIEHQIYAEYLFNKPGYKVSKKISETLVSQLQIASPYRTPVDYETQIYLAYDAPNFNEILEVEIIPEILDTVFKGDSIKTVEVKGILNYIIRYKTELDIKQISVKKVWSTCFTPNNPKSIKHLELRAITKNIYYALINKRALKVKINLEICEE